MRRKLSNKLFVIVSKGAVGTWTEKLGNEILWFEFFRNIFVLPNLKSFFASSGRCDCSCDFIVGFLANSYRAYRNVVSASGVEIIFAESSHFVPSTPAPWLHFLSVTSDFKRGMENWANQIQIFSWLLRESGARNLICTWASSCLPVLEIQRDVSHKHFKWEEKMKNPILSEM